MRLLIVINSLIQAGAEALVKDLAPRFQNHGVDVSVAVLKHLDSPFEHGLRDAGVPFLELSASGIYSPVQVAVLAKHIGSFDVVQSFLFPAQLWVAMAGPLSRSNVPLLTSEQNTDNRRRNMPYLRPLDRWMYPHYKYIPCASQAIADSLIEWVPKIAPRVSVIHNAIDLERFSAARAASKQDIIGRDDVPVAIFTARLEPQKDHLMIFRALREVPGLHLVLVGEGPLRGALEEQARTWEISDRVHFLGRRNDVPELLKMADIYVHCSHSEGFGIAAVEAMAAGLPVVVTDVPGLAQVVGEAAVLVPPGDDEKLALQLQSVLSDPDLRQKLALASRERATHFGIEQAVEQYLALYRAAIQARV